jgi:N-methylhydantoinase B
MNTPVEAAELEYPVMIERYEFIRDSGGPGRYRGGLSLRRDIKFLTDVTWARYSDRQKFEPQGIFGGLHGSKGSLILNPGTDKETVCKSKAVDQLHAGDLLSIRLPGSGGYGDPIERDPEMVRWDVINAKISPESARENYKVVLDDSRNVDIEATESLRDQFRQDGEQS